VGARGARGAIRNFRLHRDIHYVDAGAHGIDAPVRLGPGEYFVLGDNSPNSDDSRFWRNPSVPETNFLGKPFLVHLPSRAIDWDGFGRHWQSQGPDWCRVRWIR